MTGYVRVDTGNNIADGNVINAADLDNEFDGVQAAFNSSTGHTHDGTSGEGAPITKIGPVQDVVASISALYPKTTNTVDLGTSSLKYKDLFLSGSASIAGNTTIGDGSGDTVTVNGTVTSNLIFTDNTYDIGASGATRPRNLYLAGSATVAGNTTLGDATTDTVTVNGYMGVGGAAVSYAGAYIQSSALTGTGQSGLYSYPTATSAATSTINSIQARIGTAAASFTVADATSLLVADAIKGAGSTITNQHGVRIADQTQGTNNYGITSAVSSGTNKWNFYASGTADNYFAGDVGIGTSSPAQKLVVADGNILLTSSSSTDQYVEINTTATNSYSYVKGAGKNASATTRGWRAGYSPVTDTLNIVAATGIDNTTGLRIDYSGNLGLGVTPSAWKSDYRAITNGYGSFFGRTGGSVATGLAANAYLNSSSQWTYTNDYYATRYDIGDSGQHRWYTAASGTAGNAITFTQAMTLDASGNLGIGTSSSKDTLHVMESSASALTPVTASVALFERASNAAITIATASTGDSTIFFADTASNSIGRLKYGHADDSMQIWTNDLERMRVDSSGNLGIGTTSPDAKLEVTIDDATVYTTTSTTLASPAVVTQINNINTTTGVPTIQSFYASRGANLWYQGIVDTSATSYAGSFAIGNRTGVTAYSERMRITSGGNIVVGGVGNGTSSPFANKIPTVDVETTGYAVIGARGYGTTASNGGVLVLGRSNSATLGTLTATTAGQYLGLIGFEGVNSSNAAQYAAYISVAQEGTNGATYVPSNMTFFTGTNAAAPTERMRIDSSGNLGLGVTPSAWATLKALQIGYAGFFGWPSTDYAGVSSNAYYTGSGGIWNYISTNAATRYTQGSGAHTWSYAASGTAGAAITFTQAMTLDTSGNLLVGASSSLSSVGTRFSVNGDTITTSSGTYPITQEIVDTRAYNSSSPPAGGGIGFGYRYTAGGTVAMGPSIQGFKENTTDGNYAGGLRFQTRANGASPAERMRIDSSGNVGIGTTTMNNKVNITTGADDGLRLTSTSSSVALIMAGVSENRVQGLTNVPLTFYTNNTERARIDSSGNLLVGGTNQSNSGKTISYFNGSTLNGYVSYDTAGASGTTFFMCSTNGTNIGTIARVGATAAVVYNTTSDQRLKSNIEDAAPVLEKLMDVKVRQYDWTEGDLHQDYGFVAQELEPLLSGIVTKGKTEQDIWQLDYSRLTPHLLKAIQEQQAIIESLKARLDAANL